MGYGLASGQRLNSLDQAGRAVRSPPRLVWGARREASDHKPHQTEGLPVISTIQNVLPRMGSVGLYYFALADRTHCALVCLSLLRSASCVRSLNAQPTTTPAPPGTCMSGPACHAHCRGHTIKMKCLLTSALVFRNFQSVWGATFGLKKY